MKVKLSRRAEQAIRRIDRRWHASADHPDLFLIELLETVEFLETVETPGTPCPSIKHPNLKRVLLEKSKCHVYFETDRGRDLIQVLTVWDGRRERTPKL